MSSTFNPFNTGSDPTRYVELNFGEYYSSGGYNGAASVSIATSVPVVDGNGDLVMPKELKLYGSNISINLLATDLPDLKPRNFTYVIRIGESDPIHVSLPIVEKKVDFDDLVPHVNNGAIVYVPHSAIAEIWEENKKTYDDILRISRNVTTQARAVEVYAEQVKQGLAGDKGPTGDKGATGDKGPTGDTGPQGATGNKGATGDKGPTGDKGATGDKGPTGDKGATGATGAPGVTIQKGLQVVTSVNGSDVSAVATITFGTAFSAVPTIIGNVTSFRPGIKEIQFNNISKTGAEVRILYDIAQSSVFNITVNWLAVV